MSFLFGRQEQREMQPWFDGDVDGPRVVTPESAARLGAVFGSIRHLVDYISTLPADFFRVERARSEQIDPPVLAQNIESEFGWDNWIGQVVYGIVTRGNAVGRVRSTDSTGLPIRVTLAQQWSANDTGSPGWYLDGRPAPGPFVFHVPWIVPNGRRLGLSPIEHFASIVRAGLSAQEYADVRRGGGIPPTVLKHNALAEIPQEAAEKARDAAAAAFASGKPFVTAKTWDLTISNIPPAQLNFLETLKLTASQVAAIYGIDPREVGGTPDGSLTYSNDESRGLTRASNANPYIVRLENAVSRMLPAGVVMKLNTDARIRPDVKTRTEVVGAQIADGRLSVNEARELDNRPPVAGGDVHKVPTNESRSDSAARIIQQLYLGVGKIVSLQEAREIINGAAPGTNLSLDVTAERVQADLPPQPLAQAPA